MIEIIVLTRDEMTPIAAHLREGAADIVWETALQIEGVAKQNIIDQDAIDTRAMLNSTSAALGDHELEAYVGPTVEYAGFVEHGTIYMPARPFLEPAVEAAEPEFLRQMEDLLHG